MNESRNCLQCGKPVKGRIDKKFCDDWCRNAFNNRLHSEENNIIRNINNSLRRNRRILEKALRNGKKSARIHRRYLLSEGFDFRFTTHSLISTKGHSFSFCYEFGYLPLDNEEYLVVKSKDREN